MFCSPVVVMFGDRRRRNALAERKVEGFCCPVPSETAPDVARRQGFKFRLFALRYAARAASA
jgi:hypothetical protein